MATPSGGIGSGALAREFAAHNYDPLPVVLARGSGAWVEDESGRRYLDFIGAYSALNFGHCHPRLIDAAHRQLDRLTLTSRAVDNDQFGPLCAELAALCGMESVLMMNTGAEADETAIKLARRWAYRVKGVSADQATIVVFDGNFHGRTTTIVGFSGDEESRAGFGPFTPGFVSVPYGDVAAVARVVGERTAAVLVEPVQGEAGVIVPPLGFLSGLRELCSRTATLLIADEVQTGLGRTGRTFACDHEGVRPDVLVLGKALGGGILPVSAVVADRARMDVFTPGSHGSTFGGNPLAGAVAREVVAMLATGELQARAARLGAVLRDRLLAIADAVPGAVGAVRTIGLWAGVDLDPRLASSAALGPAPARIVAERLLEHGVLAKDTHGRTLRLAPPLVIDDADLHRGLDAVHVVLAELASE